MERWIREEEEEGGQHDTRVVLDDSRHFFFLDEEFFSWPLKAQNARHCSTGDAFIILSVAPFHLLASKKFRSRAKHSKVAAGGSFFFLRLADALSTFQSDALFLCFLLFGSSWPFLSFLFQFPSHLFLSFSCFPSPVRLALLIPRTHAFVRKRGTEHHGEGERAGSGSQKPTSCRGGRRSLCGAQAVRPGQRTDGWAALRRASQAPA